MIDSDSRREGADHERLPPGSQPGIIDSRLLSASGFRHAFFTRTGGVSEEPFDSLNFSSSVGDLEARVAQNLALAARFLRVEPEKIFFLNQVHGVACHEVSGDDDRKIRALQGDAVVSSDPEVACAVRIADCAPILMADRRSGAVIAVHSGWRGTLQNIAAVAADRLRFQVQGEVDLIAAVGPHIGPCCFEVGDDVARLLLEASPDKDIVRPGRGERPHVDLRRMIQAQLLQAGVREIDHVEGCTYCEPHRFFSFRRGGKRSGRHLAAICPRK
jgi:polyphenol oxidase